MQLVMAFFQVRHYQKTIKKWLGKGILGIGQRKGFLKPGELIILIYNRQEGKAISVQSMRGFTVFAGFREVKKYSGCSLEELRQIGIERDAEDMKWYRRKHPYDPLVPSKKKGALIQAVEAVERHIEKQKEKEREMEDDED